MTTRTKRLKGLRALIGDVVEHGSAAVERVHLATARRPFAVLEQVPGLAEPSALVHQIHDAAVTGVYATVRIVSRTVGVALDAVIDAGEKTGER